MLGLPHLFIRTIVDLFMQEGRSSLALTVWHAKCETSWSDTVILRTVNRDLMGGCSLTRRIFRGLLLLLLAWRIAGGGVGRMVHHLYRFLSHVCLSI